MPSLPTTNRRRRSRTVAAAAAALVAASAGCATPPAGADLGSSGTSTGPGTIINVTPLGGMSADAAQQYLSDAEHDGGAVAFAVESYKVVYRTVDADGQPTRASGLLVLPEQARAPLHPVLYGHGTTNDRTDVASTYTDDFNVSPGIAFAARGFAALLPDYVGLGESPGPHPYLDLPTQTSAATDMLTAVGDHLAAAGRPLAPEVFASGFSQGASTALGVGRALDEDKVPGFELGGLAAISGAYALRRVQVPAMVAGQVAPQVAVPYTAFLLTSWGELHDLYDAPAEVFQAPYADRVQRLFSGEVSGEEMIASLPASTEELLTDTGRTLLTDPGPAMAAAFSAADSVCRGWTPSAPVRLYGAQDDEQAVWANTASCEADFATQGHAPDVRDLGTPARYESRHLGTQVTGTDDAADWFLTLAR